MRMDIDLDEVELGFVINLANLREVLRKLSIKGRRWWIASDPADALERGCVTIGHGDPGCVDRLNTLYYRAPILNVYKPLAGTEQLILLIESSVIVHEQHGLYVEDGRVWADEQEDLECFFAPIERALVDRLREHECTG